MFWLFLFFEFSFKKENENGKMHSKHVLSESEQIAGPKCLTFYEKLQYHLTVSDAIKWHNLVSQAVSIKILMFLFGVDDYNLVFGGAGS